MPTFHCERTFWIVAFKSNIQGPSLWDSFSLSLIVVLLHKIVTLKKRACLVLQKSLSMSSTNRSLSFGFFLVTVFCYSVAVALFFEYEVYSIL